MLAENDFGDNFKARFAVASIFKTLNYSFIHIDWIIVKDLIIILLVIACAKHFIPGEVSQGIVMLVALVFVTTSYFIKKFLLIARHLAYVD